jgi:hypothetical protein
MGQVNDRYVDFGVFGMEFADAVLFLQIEIWQIRKYAGDLLAGVQFREIQGGPKHLAVAANFVHDKPLDALNILRMPC